jgi:hypothetical protein
MQTRDHLLQAALLRDRLAQVEADRDAALALIEEIRDTLGPKWNWPNWGKAREVLERIDCFLGHDDLLLREENHD